MAARSKKGSGVSGKVKRVRTDLSRSGPAKAGSHTSLTEEAQNLGVDVVPSVKRDEPDSSRARDHEEVATATYTSV